MRNNRAFGEGNCGFTSSYFYPSLHLPVETSSYSKHTGNNALWKYEQLMAPVHIPTESPWLLLLISVLNLCLYIYDSVRCTTAAYRTIFDIIKEGFIRNELQWLSDEDNTLFQEDNWDESAPQCLKQNNDTDCGAFTSLFAKTPTVVEKQPFRPYSQWRASRWNCERFIRSCVSFAHWKRVTPGFPVDGRQYQRIPKKPEWEMQDLLIASPQPQKMAIVCFMQCMTW